MSLSRSVKRLLHFGVVLCLVHGTAASAIEGYVLGAGIDADSEGGLTPTVIGDVGLTENTWLSAIYASNSGDLSTQQSLNTQFVDVSLDHFFDPIGIRVGAAYWGDSEILDSDDIKGAIYWRGESAMVSINFEQRDFEFDLFRDTALPTQDVMFAADGLGLSARFGLNDNVNLSFSGIAYDYDVNLRRAANRPILSLLSATRLSVINSLIDHRARVGLSVDHGERQWSFDLATWEGAADASKTNSFTARVVTPVGDRFDLELGLGVDDSDLYGSVTFFSVFLYFYGD